MSEKLPKQLIEVGSDAYRISRGLFLIGVSYGAPFMRKAQPHLSKFWQDETGVQIGPDWYMAKEKTD